MQTAIMARAKRKYSKPPLQRIHRGEGSVIANVHYNQVKVYSRKCTTGYTASTGNKYRNTKCDYMYKDFYIGVLFYLNSFLSAKHQCFNISKIHNCTQLHFVRYIRVLLRRVYGILTMTSQLQVG
jgi:hypothetical protein